MKPIISKRSLIISGVAIQSALVGWLIYLQVGQTHLAKRVEPFEPEIIEHLSQSQDGLKVRTAAIEQRQNDQDVEEQLAEMLLLQEETSRHVQQLQGLRTESDELRTLIGARIESLEREVSVLKEQRSKPAQAVPAKQAISSPKRTPAKPPLPPVRPFMLIGIEARGGESFASVAPKQSARLDQVRLLKPGESFGDWRLLKIEPAGKAVFTVHDQQQVIEPFQE